MINRLKNITNVVFISMAVSGTSVAQADINRSAVTFDNDFFVGNDDGYTNGLYISLFDVGDAGRVGHDFWVAPLMWSMPAHKVFESVNAYTLGQTLSTPTNIDVKEPAANELPYSALLALTNAYVTVTPQYADRVSTTMGFVGPIAMGEESQKIVHHLIGSDQPKGWNTQLKNEVVFQVTRARMWRSWVSKSNHFDLLTDTEVDVGTIQSAVSAGVTWRYGKGLQDSYHTRLFSRSRTSNPIAVNTGWFVFGSVQGGYIFNQIFTDGNTFTDSRSVDYDHQFIALSVGVTRAWKDFSVSFSIKDSNLVQSTDSDAKLKNSTQYGSLTIAWKI